MKKRNEEYEKKFRAYLFSFDFETHKKICGNLNVKPNIPEKLDSYERETLKKLIENEISSTEDYILGIKGEEKECWECNVQELNEILKKI